MVVGEIAESIDLLVVGAGPGGYVAALRAAELGRQVVVVDRGGPEGGLGGACLHVGCIPSKALIELAHTRAQVERLGAAGLEVESVAIDMRRFQIWKQEIVDRLAAGIGTLFKQASIRHIVGELRFNRPDRAAVLLPDGNVMFLEFEQAIIATGSRSVELAELPFDGDRVLSSTGALALAELPRSVAVVGAGYIGLELGMALAQLGVQVSVIEALDRVLPSFEAALTRPVLRNLKRLGVELHLSSLARGLQDGGLLVEQRGATRLVPAEKVIVAVGRIPNTDDLGLGPAAVPVGEDGRVQVDERRLATPRVAAIGDVTAGPALAHKASAEAAVAAEALCGLPVAFEVSAIPAVAFTDPEIATAGLTETQAREAGFDVAVARSSLGASGRAATLGAREGFTSVVSDRETDRVLGVHIVGPHASELIAEGTLAVEMVASPVDLLGTIHPHPSLSESLHDAAAGLLARPPVAVG
ncbi:MAG: dihydrolipoyl dehydrogenase [Solirubrobacterales bacterium]|nr:dihydrolipoyl dehydrogenase [Solirubrobacterales bacterium]